MPQTKVKKNLSALKEARKNLRRNQRNSKVKSELKSLVKKINKTVEKKDTAKAQEMLKLAFSRFDKAAQKRIIHPHQAARKKSQLSLLISKSGSPASS